MVSYSRVSRRASVDLPEPLPPTTATVCPGAIEKLTSHSTCRPCSYEKSTCSKATSPRRTSSGSARGASLTSAGSSISSMSFSASIIASLDCRNMKPSALSGMQICSTYELTSTRSPTVMTPRSVSCPASSMTAPTPAAMMAP